MRTLVVVLFRFVLRIFFRRVEVVHEDKVPQTGPILLALNHPNALVDPALVVCFGPRPVSFLAKSTLFDMPVVSLLVRGIDSVPVYRLSDMGADTRDAGAPNRPGSGGTSALTGPARNKKTFEKAREILGRGGAIAIFPEGTSHSDPKLRPLKTGAARIALGAAAGGEGLEIVPAGLFFTDKIRFRSDAVLIYGDPIAVEPVELDTTSEPPRAAVKRLTDQIAAALDQVTLQADQAEAHALVARAERIFSAADANQSPRDAFELRRAFIHGYQALKDREPKRIRELDARIERLERECRGLGLDQRHLSPGDFTLRKVAAYALRSLLALSLMIPAAIVGAAIHVLPYHLIDLLAVRYAREEDDMLATCKVLGAMLFFPLTWLVVGAIVWISWGPMPAVVSVVVAPLSGWLALRFAESFGGLRSAARGLAVFMGRRREYHYLVLEQQKIRDEIIALGELVGEGPDQ